MSATPQHSIRWTLLLSGALALGAAACGGDDSSDGGTPDAGRDAGVDIDAGPADSGVRRDAGFPDAGPAPDAGHFCAPNDEVDVNGTAVPVGAASPDPRTARGNRPNLRCIDDPPDDEPPFISELCVTECVEFFGPEPSMADVQDLDVAVFEQVVDGQTVDPSFDFQTGLDRQPEARTGAGFRFSPNTQNCDSGWQVEIGYNNLGDVLLAETKYIIRVRSAPGATSEWPTLYLYDFIRRNDQVPQVSVCGNDEQRIPSVSFDFPVLTSSFLSDAVAATQGTVVGADDLGDGLGSGHALLETRDCTGGGGALVSGAAAGFAPQPEGAFYIAEDFSLATDATTTTPKGLYLGVGFPGNTATSSMTVDVAAAVGLSTDGTCTEEFGGLEIPVFSDSVTFLRMNRETVVHGR